LGPNQWRNKRKSGGRSKKICRSARPRKNQAGVNPDQDDQQGKELSLGEIVETKPAIISEGRETRLRGPKSIW